MAEQGLCSRREADQYIAQGQVLVDGEVISRLGSRIYPHQRIQLIPSARAKQSQLVTVLINKPAGYVSGLPEKGYQSAVMLINRKNAYNKNCAIPHRGGLAPAGRLDIDSTGLIVFTQDGRIARLLISPQSNIEKEYQVCVEGNITQEKIKLLRHGLSLDHRPLKKAQVEQVGDSRLLFILKEGRKRQIRRMCSSVSLEVTRLMRTRIGNVVLGDLPRGKWRLLNADEGFGS